MLLIQPGDYIFSYFDGAFRAVGIAVSSALDQTRPDFGFANSFWDEDGWLVRVAFDRLERPWDPKTRLDIYQASKPIANGPLNSNGEVQQQYLFQLPLHLGEFYFAQVGVRREQLLQLVSEETRFDAESTEEQEIGRRRDIGETEKRSLVKARRGQGIFRSEVERIERRCRITGVAVHAYLRASHIKPWSKSTDTERLEGANGLLLSPHVDHLFDRGYISFQNDGTVLTSPHLSDDVVNRWKLDLISGVGSFTRSQSGFLEFHRDEIFRKREMITNKLTSEISNEGQ
jgi:putative restriction endonuclease